MNKKSYDKTRIYYIGHIAMTYCGHDDSTINIVLGLLLLLLLLFIGCEASPKSVVLITSIDLTGIDS